MGPAGPAPEGAAAPDVLDTAEAGSKAIRASGLRAGGYVLGISLSLISAPLLIRHLGVDRFGDYVTVTALVTMVAGVSEAGLTAVGTREYSVRADDARAALMRVLLGARTALTIAAAAAAVGFAAAARYDAAMVIGTAVASVSYLTQAYQGTLTIPLIARLRQGWVTAIDLGRQAVTVAVIVALVLAGAGLLPLLASALPAAVLSVVVTARLVGRGAWGRPVVRPAAWWPLLRDSLAFAAASAIGVVYLRATMVVMSLVAPAEDGFFATAFRIVETIVGVPILLVAGLFPIFARAAAQDLQRLRYALGRTFEVSATLGMLVAVSFVFGAPLAILALVGEETPRATEALRILGCGLGASFVAATTQFGLLALRRHRAILALNVAALALNIGLTLVLADRYGATGGAIALAVSELFLAVVGATLVCRAIALAPPLATLARVALAAAVAAGAGLLGARFGDVGALLAAGLAAAAATVALGLVPAEVRDAALRRRDPTGA